MSTAENIQDTGKKNPFDKLTKLSNLMKDQKQPVASGTPVLVDIDLLDEDPTNRNGEYDQEFLKELAEDIKVCGVKQPISIRPNPDAPGRFIMNDGHQRKRSSLMAGKTQIPAFYDDNFTSYDSAKVNMKRRGWSGRAMAVFIGMRLKEGDSQSEIARNLGVSAAFVSQHVKLLNLPEPLADAFNSGRCNDVTRITDLATLYKRDPETVKAWIENEDQEITVGTVKTLRELMEEKKHGHDQEHDQEDEGGDNRAESEEDGKPKPKEKKPNDPEAFKGKIVCVEHRKRPARIIMNKRPPAYGFMWIKYDEDGEELEVDVKSLKLVALLEA